MTWSLPPRLAADTHHVASLELSELLLMDNRLHPWLILVPRVPDAVEWIDLPERERHRLLDEVTLAGELLRRLRMPDKLNVAALGNVVAQLHVHVVARFVDDVAWPKPVWGAAPAEPYGADLLARTLGELRSALP